MIPPRRPPRRPPGKILAIVRQLRQRFVTPEIEGLARESLARLTRDNPGAARRLLAIGSQDCDGAAASCDPHPFLTMIRQREGIVPATAGETGPSGDFSAGERARARRILAGLRASCLSPPPSGRDRDRPGEDGRGKRRFPS